MDSPALIPLPSQNAFTDVLRGEDDRRESLRPVRADLADLLGPTVAAESKTVLCAISDTLTRAERSAAKYRPSFADPPVFPTTSSIRDIGVTVNLSPVLKSNRFEISAEAIERLPKTEKPWVVRGYVETGQDGSASTAFIDEPSEDPSVNAAVLGALYAGRLRGSGSACCGLVTIAWQGRTR